MKTAMTALAVVLLAQAGPAFAQRGERDRAEREDRPSRAEMAHDRPQRDGADGGREWRGDGQRPREEPRPAEAPRAAEPPPAPEAPRAAEPRTQDRARVPGDSVGRPGPWTRNTEGYRGGDRQGDGRQGDGRQGGDRRDNDRGDRNDGRRDGDRNDWNRNGGDHRDGDRRDDAHRDGDHRDGGHGDWDRRHRNDRHDYRRWEHGRYPSVYFSSHRYRSYWRPPVGYYARVWGFGDFLPRGWYGEQYYLTDPWDYDLPLPPPGYDWVRVGYDALLIDSYTGRVVQVVRNAFW